MTLLQAGPTGQVPRIPHLTQIKLAAGSLLTRVAATNPPCTGHLYTAPSASNPIGAARWSSLRRTLGHLGLPGA
jgi:hypothetical protein